MRMRIRPYRLRGILLMLRDAASRACRVNRDHAFLVLILTHGGRLDNDPGRICLVLRLLGDCGRR